MIVIIFIYNKIRVMLSPRKPLQGHYTTTLKDIKLQIKTTME